MEDEKIVALYFERNEDAISETEKKYGRFCRYIAYQVLHSSYDAEECVNDTYIRAWESIPPTRPCRLSAFLATVCRNLAFNRYDRERAEKRNGGIALVLEEVEEWLPDPREGDLSDTLALKTAINGFLESLDTETRMLFVRRYFYLSPIREIARDYGFGESKVKVTLFRTREKFKAYLEKEGIRI